MLVQTYRLQYAHGAFILVLLTLIAWGFISAWYQTDAYFNRMENTGLSTDYSYLLNSDLMEPEALSDDMFTNAELNHTPATYGNINQWFQIKVINGVDSENQLNLIIDNRWVSQRGGIAQAVMLIGGNFT